MTAKDREMLIRIDERTNANTALLKKLDETINGNGKVGMKAEFDEVKHNQETCMAQRAEKKVDWKYTITTIVAFGGIVVAILALLVK